MANIKKIVINILVDNDGKISTVFVDIVVVAVVVVFADVTNILVDNDGKISTVFVDIVVVAVVVVFSDVVFVDEVEGTRGTVIEAIN